MAYLFYKRLILGISDSETNVITFLDPNTACNYATISFYQINRKNNASRNLCLNGDYYIRLYIPGRNGDYYLGYNNGPENIFTAVSMGSPNMIIFRSMVSLGGKIGMNKPFVGKFIRNYMNPENAKSKIITIVPSDYYREVGYNEPLSSILNSCPECPCPNGEKCDGLGNCVPIPSPCSPNSPCAGNCYGGCQSGSECVESGGKYECLSGGSSNGILAWILGFILLALILGLLYWALTKTYKKPKVSNTSTNVNVNVNKKPTVSNTIL